MRRSHLIAIVVLVGCSRQGPPTTKPIPPQVVRYAALMHQRCLLMPDVARWKWKAEKPIEDPEREAEMLKVQQAKAKEAGLDEEFSAKVIRARMEAAKHIQKGCFERWKQGNPVLMKEDRSLQEIREQINGIDAELLTLLADKSIDWRSPATVVDLETRMNDWVSPADDPEVRKLLLAAFR